MPGIRRVVFLPGASGAAAFWRPVADRLPAAWSKVLLSWPGAGVEPHDPSVRGFSDLVTEAGPSLAAGSDLVAHSMGGAVAIGLALQHPDKVRRMVLVATSGGLDVTGLGAADWRAEYQELYPSAAPWICSQRPDHTRELKDIEAPTLLLWSDEDPTSPLAVGERLADLLPHSTLQVVPGGSHQFAQEHPEAVARLILDHLQ